MKKNKIFLIILLIINLKAYSQNTNNNTITDAGGNVYKTVVIGKQTWMAENLRYKTESGCWAYNNDEANIITFGYLYNWQTANSICPNGWHLPSASEWSILSDFLGGVAIAGGKLKSNTNWKSPNTGVFQYNSFFAQPSGIRNRQGGYFYQNEWAVFWTSTIDPEYNEVHKTMVLTCDKSYLMPLMDQDTYGNSVRCIKD